MTRQQSTGELSRTIAGQWTKSEKRAAASRSIVEANRRTHAILKRFAQQQRIR
jgi:hypothetical protein